MECFIFLRIRVGAERKEKSRDLRMEEDTAEVKEVLCHLPHDVIVHQILTRLPIKPLLQFKCVSKQWYSILSSYQFAQIYSRLSSFSKPTSHTEYLFIQNENNYYLLYHDDEDPTYDVKKNLFKLRNNFQLVLDEKLVLIGSCNGLICLASSSGYFFVLWNPITGVFRKYSDHELSISSSCPFRVTWGFGYVSSVDDYKVTRILELPATLDIRVHVFSLKSNKWTRVADDLYQDIFSLRSPTVGTFPFYDHHTNTQRDLPYTFLSSRGVLVNESLYWIVSKTNGLGRKIVAFDLGSQVFDANVDLDLRSTELAGDRFICNMGGFLSKFGDNFRDDVFIGILRCPGKVETIRIFRSLNLTSCKDLVGFTNTGKFFILQDYAALGLVDPCSKPMKYTRLVKFEMSESLFSWTGYISSFVPSLTLPYTVGELSGKTSTC